MRKLHILGAAVVATAAVAFGALQWVKSRAHREIMASINQLRAGGAAVTHGAVNVDAWSRAVTIDRLEILSAQEPKVLVSIKSVAADGVMPEGAGGRAKRLLLRDITVGSAAGTGASKPYVSIPEASLVDFRFAPRALESKSGDPIIRGVEQFAHLSAKAVAIPTLATSMTIQIDPKSQMKSNFDYTYDRIDLFNVEDGRIGQLKIGKLTLAADLGGQKLMSGTIDGMDSVDIDLMPIFELGLDRRKPEGRLYRVQGKTRLGAYTIKTQPDITAAIGESTISDAWLDPTKVSYQTVTALLPVIERMGPNPTEAQSKELLRLMTGFYDGMRMDQLAIKDMRVKANNPGTPPVNFAMARMTMEGLRDGKLKRLSIEDIDGEAPNARGRMEPFKMGLFALDELNMNGLLRLAETGQKNPPPDVIARAVMGLLQGFEMSGVEVPQPGSPDKLKLEQLKLSWGQYIDGIPSLVKARFKSEIPLNPGDIRLAPLAAAGIRKFDVDLDLTAAYDEAKKSIGIEPLDIAVGPFGRIKGRMTALNVPRSAFSGNPADLNAAAEKIELGIVDLALTDGGLVDLIRKLAGPEAIDLIKLSAQQQTAGNPDLERLSAAFFRFIEQPKRTLSLRLRPKNPTPIMSLFLVGGMAGPAAVIAGLTIDVDVK